MKNITSVLLLIFSQFAYCQDWRYEEVIPKYKSEILSESNLENERESRVLRDLSYIGEYQELYERDNYVDTTIEKEIKRLTKGYKKIGAKRYVISTASKQQVLIINESHHRPEHRQFTSNLLESLYKEGYRYLALEAILSNQHSAKTHYPYNKYNLGDTTILNRGYPLMKPCSGTYVKEPTFGLLIRKAISLGYTIIGYEENGKEREKKQAINIARILELNPGAKIIVHCGYGHLIESPRQRGNGEPDTLMAGYLKEITGINPFTVDQTSYYNLRNINQFIFKNSDCKSPIGLIKENVLFKSHKIENQDYWDMTIFHPPMSFIDKRPEWFYKGEDKNIFTIDCELIKIDYPIRMKLLEIQDRLDAVPIDILEMDNNDNKDLKLYGNIENAKVIVENLKGERQILKIE